MSWFTAGLEKLKEVTDKVKEAVPVDTTEMRSGLNKLFLNSDEMKAERTQFGEEAKRKDQAKNMLAGMLPWETRDSERDILVEECKEAIMALSGSSETFFGPYEMPALPVKGDSEDKKEGEEEEEEEEEEEIGVDAGKEQKPSEESLEKLAKLEPLPPLLGDFDLDAHVGLIQKLLEEDPQLVKMQSTLSGEM
jgi:hypothetical protein